MDRFDKIMAMHTASAWSDWTPTLTWTTANPTTPTTIARYKLIGKTCFFAVQISSTDGNGATGLRFTLPATPKNIGANVPVNSQTLIGSSDSVRSAAVRANGTNNDCYFVYMGTATSASALGCYIAGQYEIA